MAHLPPRSTLHGGLIRWHCDGVLDQMILSSAMSQRSKR
jgi:hypothetical protein